MHCPYCTSDISDAALVCPVCTRDLYLFKPLLQKIEHLEAGLKEVAGANTKALEDRIAALESELVQWRASPGSATQQPYAETHAAAAHAASPRSYLTSALIALGATLVLLLAAHGLIIMVYDLKPLWLRIASLLIPLPFGIALYVWHPRRFGMSAALAIFVACLAVIGMSAVTGYVDKVPVLPESNRDWREFIEYVASIALSSITVLLLGKLRAIRVTSPRRQPGRLVMFIAQMFTRHDDGELGLQKMIARINKLVATVTPAASAAMSVYTGVRAVLGNG